MGKPREIHHKILRSHRGMACSQPHLSLVQEPEERESFSSIFLIRVPSASASGKGNDAGVYVFLFLESPIPPQFPLSSLSGNHSIQSMTLHLHPPPVEGGGLPPPSHFPHADTRPSSFSWANRDFFSPVEEAVAAAAAGAMLAVRWTAPMMIPCLVQHGFLL